MIHIRFKIGRKSLLAIYYRILSSFNFIHYFSFDKCNLRDCIIRIVYYANRYRRYWGLP